MNYWEMGIWKANEFNFLNKNAEKFTSRQIQNMVSVRSPSDLKQKTFEYCLWGISRLYIQFSIPIWYCVLSVS